jgi:hypothetical protein
MKGKESLEVSDKPLKTLPIAILPGVYWTEGNEPVIAFPEGYQKYEGLTLKAAVTQEGSNNLMV